MEQIESTFEEKDTKYALGARLLEDKQLFKADMKLNTKYLIEYKGYFSGSFLIMTLTDSHI